MGGYCRFPALADRPLIDGAFGDRRDVFANFYFGGFGNNWIDQETGKTMYCTEDKNSKYIGEDTQPDDGTSPANLRVSTLGDELRYSNGNQSKVVTVSGKDRGAILPAAAKVTITITGADDQPTLAAVTEATVSGTSE